MRTNSQSRTEATGDRRCHYRRLAAPLLLVSLALAACTGPTAPAAQPAPEAFVEDAATAALPAGFDLQGHRGARGLKPENTLPAFETALDLGVTTLELDLHLTADGVPVIWHDPELPAEKCSGAPVGKRISQLTLAEVQAARCDKNPDPAAFPAQDNGPTPLAGDDYRIVSLAELFDFVAAYAEDPAKTEAQRENAHRVQFNVETKRKPEDPAAIGDGFDGVHPGPFEQAVVDLVTERGLTERVVVQSFDHRSLWAVRQLDPAIRLAALTSGGRPDPAAYAQGGAAIWSPRYQDLTPSLLAAAHEAGLLVIPWTVNDPDQMRRLIDLGVDGLITDRPDLAPALAE